MYRITLIENHDDSVTLKVEGRLGGLCVEELRQIWQDTMTGWPVAPVTVNLTKVTFIDDAGRKLLRQICAAGARVQASGCHTRGIVDEIESQRCTTAMVSK